MAITVDPRVSQTPNVEQAYYDAQQRALNRTMEQRRQGAYDRTVLDAYQTFTPSFDWGEDWRSASYCTASRSHWMSTAGRPPVPEPVEMPWLQVEGAAAGSLAKVLNDIAAETTVTILTNGAFSHSARVLLPNGWQVSLAFGLGTQSALIPGSPSRVDNTVSLANAMGAVEVALLDPDGQFLDPHGGRRTWGHISAREIPRIIDAVAAIGTRESCPCPSCVLDPDVDVYVRVGEDGRLIADGDSWTTSPSFWFE